VQIFCDESGGVDGNHFLVAAITVADSCATRIVKSFRKAVKMSSEIRGHSLSETNRRIFFDILNKEGDAFAIVAHCGRNGVVGGWAMIQRHAGPTSITPIRQRNIQPTVDFDGFVWHSRHRHCLKSAESQYGANALARLLRKFSAIFLQYLSGKTYVRREQRPPNTSLS
jgi:hypothetical protein